MVIFFLPERERMMSPTRIFLLVLAGESRQPWWGVIPGSSNNGLCFILSLGVQALFCF